MACVLIIDDDDAFRAALHETLVGFGHEVIEARSGEDGLARFGERAADAVLVDFRMPGLDGLSTLRKLRELPGFHAPVVMLTAFATADNTIEAMKLGAYDHLAKPVSREEVRRVVERVLRQSAPGSAHGGEGVRTAQETLIGASAPMRQVQKLIGMAAASDASVLITGETGSGKELAARLLHRASGRAGGPFVAVNCAAIPPELLESELFGHVRGSFTGAVGPRRGSFREADGGTLFLDEIGDMPLAMQAKILRALQEREVTPVGADRAEKIDVRVVAATHRDLPTLIADGRFRQDLFFRLDVVPIDLPPLRQRVDDIVPLAKHFLSTADAPAKQLSPQACERLLAHPWPGNVRELKNAMERLGVVVRGAVIEAEDLTFLSASTRGDGLPKDLLALSLPDALAAVEKALIERALCSSSGKAEAARKLGINRQLLYTRLKQLGLEGDE